MAESGCAIAYVNQVGGQDELVFDGGSFVMDASGTVLAAAPRFVETTLLVDVPLPGDDPVTTLPVVPVSTAPRAGTGCRCQAPAPRSARRPRSTKRSWSARVTT